MLRVRKASRTTLAQLTHMSQATVGRIADDLLAQAILGEAELENIPAAGSAPLLGRPSKLLELNRSRRRFLLIQLGVRQTRIAAAAVAIPEAEVWDITFPTRKSIQQWLHRLRRSCRKLPLDDIEAAVVSCPGVVDEPAGKVLLSPNLRWSEKMDFVEGIQSIVNKPAIYVQEIRALAVGQLAAEPELEDFLLVDVGDGLGGASVIGGQLQSGHIPLSGELGHTPALNNNRRCGCGSIGCIETLVSRRGLLRSFKEHGGEPTWAALISHLQEAGMPKWLKSALDAVAITVAAAINVEGIPNVLFTGSITEFPSEIIQYLSRQVSQGAMWSRLGTVTCRAAPRRRMAGMISTGIDRVLFARDHQGGPMPPNNGRR